MTALVVLGSANAIPTDNQENSHLLVDSTNQCVLIDCASRTIQLLANRKIIPNRLQHIIITHFHPDHVSSLPLLLMDLWLMGRKDTIWIHANAYTVERINKLMELFNWHQWPGFFPVEFVEIPEDPLTTVIETVEYRILASPVKHLIPTLGLRFEFSGRVFAYSCDTEPCQAVVALGRQADALIHEASGDTKGHTSALQAGTIATQAGAKALYLIHYPGEQKDLLKQAKSTFTGQVFLAVDNLEFPDHQPVINGTQS